MKKLTAFILSALMAVTALTGCGGQSSSSEASKDNSSSQSSTGDWSYIADKGDLVIGITYFEPIFFAMAAISSVLSLVKSTPFSHKI